MKRTTPILMLVLMLLLTAPETGKPGDLPIKDYLAELE